MSKVEELSGSGGAVEAVFFLRDVRMQWRFSGTAFIIGGDDNSAKEHEARREIGKRLRKLELEEVLDEPSTGGGGVDGLVGEKQKEKGFLPYSWDKAVTVYFANQSPVLRGEFRSFILSFFIYVFADVDMI